MNDLSITLLLNIGSLLLGLAAMMLAALAFIRAGTSYFCGFSAGSFSLCSLSLLLQIAEISHRAQMNDFSAIADTIRAVLIASAVLIVLTVAVNTAALLRQHRAEQSD